jgi:hypothetical protein
VDLSTRRRAAAPHRHRDRCGARTAGNGAGVAAHEGTGRQCLREHGGNWAAQTGATLLVHHRRARGEPPGRAKHRKRNHSGVAPHDARERQTPKDRDGQMHDAAEPEQ